MDTESAGDVIKGTIAVSFIGGLTGAAYGAWKRQPPAVLGTATALNSGLSAFIFFSTREYLIKPSWQAARGQTGDAGGPLLGQPSSSAVRQTRLEGVPETVIAGSLTGGVLNGWKHGPRALVSGTLTWAVVTGLAHIGYNQLRLARIQYVSKRMGSSAAGGAHSSEPGSSPTSSISDPPPREFSNIIMDIMTWVAPVKKLSDEEYVEVMKRKQAEVDRRIRQIDQELSRGNKSRSSDDSRNL